MSIVLTLIAESLWQRVRAVFARARAVFGDAARIAAMRDLTESARRGIVARLAPLEAMARKLLLVEAARFAEEARAQTQIGAQRGAASARQAQPQRSPTFDLARPETWPGRFSLAAPSDPKRVANDRAPRIRALWHVGGSVVQHAASENGPAGARPQTALQLARRVEALRRVLEDPLPHARRLARVIARALRRFPEIVRHYAMAPARTGDYDPEDPRLLLECMARAFGVAWSLDTG